MTRCCSRMTTRPPDRGRFGCRSPFLEFLPEQALGFRPAEASDVLDQQRMLRDPPRAPGAARSMARAKTDDLTHASSAFPQFWTRKRPDYVLRRDGMALEKVGESCRSISRVPNVKQMIGSGHHIVLGARPPRAKQVAALDVHRQTLGPV